MLTITVKNITIKTRKPLLQHLPISFSSLDEKMRSTLSSLINKVINTRLVPDIRQWQNQEHVGLYNSLNKSAFYVNISASDLPKDRLIREYVYYLIPVPGAIVLYILTGGITIFITVQLIFYLYYRDHKVIKATSPYLSLVMFFGCYLLCLSAIVNITIDSFVTIPTIYTTLFCLIILLTINGTSLVLITFPERISRPDLEKLEHMFSRE